MVQSARCERRPLSLSWGAEQPYDLANSPRKAKEHCRDFLIRNAELSFVERYMRGDVCVALRHIESVGHIADHLCQDGFIFQALNPAQTPYVQISASTGCSGDVRALKEEAADIGARGDKSLMFSQYVELVEGPKGMIPSLVRFERFDRGLLPLGEPLFAFDASQGVDHRLLGTEDWEMRVSVRLVTVPATKRGPKKIERCAYTVNDHTDFDVDSGIKRAHQYGNQHFFAGLGIYLGFDFIRAFCVPGGEFFLENWDLGYGPINTRP